MTPTTIPAGDGTPLFVRTLRPAGPPRGDVVILHGLGDHAGRWEQVAGRLGEAGFEVHTFDQRGFGRSGGRRAWVARWEDLLDDLETVIADRCSRPRPLVLYGHSMGGLVALGYAVSPRRRPDRLVLSAPAVDADVSAAKRLLVRVLGRVAPRLSVRNDITGEQLARDPAVGAAYFADPLVLTETTTGFGLEFLRAMAGTRRALDRLDVPTLVVHGDRDTLVPAAVSEPLTRIGCVERIVLPGSRHEWHNDPEGDDVLGRIVEWILAGS